MDDFKKLLFLGLVVSVPAGLASVLLPLYLQDLGISYTEMGLIFAIGPVLGLLLNYFVGSHSDKVGRRIYLIIGSAIFSVYFLILAFALNSWQFALASLAWSSYSAISGASATAYLCDIVPKTERGKQVGLYNGALGIATVLAMFIAGFLLIYLGYKNIFLACVLFGVVAILSSLKLNETLKPETKSSAKMSNALDINGVPKQIKFLFILIFIVNFACQTITAFGFPLYFKSLGAEAGLIGILLGIMWIGPFFSELFFGKFADKIDPAKLYLFSFLVIIPVNVILIFVTNPLLAATLLFVQGAAFGLEGLVIIRLTFGSVGNNSGRDTAFASNAGYLAVTFGSLAGGLIMDHLGFSYIFIFRVILFSICALLMVFASRKIFPPDKLTKG